MKTPSVQEIRKFGLALSIAFLVSACGGGGESRTLTVDFEYPSSTALLWRASSFPIRTSGLEGNAPVCRIVDGRLPAGLVLQADGCAITGVPTEVITTSFTVRLTVNGFEGQVDKLISASVVGPAISYDFSRFAGTFPTAGEAISVSPVDPFLRASWTPAPGDSILYSVRTGSLPEGLSLNPTSGTISGVFTTRDFTEQGSFSISVSATSPLGNYSENSDTYELRAASGLRLSYPTTQFTQAGVSTTLSPIVEHRTPPPRPLTDYAFSNYRIDTGSDSLPGGMALDAATGVISGAPASAGSWSLVVAADVTVDGQTGKIRSPFVLTVFP